MYSPAVPPPQIPQCASSRIPRSELAKSNILQPVLRLLLKSALLLRTLEDGSKEVISHFECGLCDCILTPVVFQGIAVKEVNLVPQGFN